jgi:hypothetical protein
MFSDDSQIRRTTPITLFKQRLNNDKINCHRVIPGHEKCSTYVGWKKMHTIDASALKNEAASIYKSVFVPVFKDVLIHGKPVKISGGIKSLDPPCKGEALSYGDHPYTCDNCFYQLRDLKDTLRHRHVGSLEGKRNRLGLKGFNKRYAKKGEMVDALEVETQRRKLAEGTVKQMVRRTLSQSEWEDSLHEACLNGEDQKLAIDLVRLMKMGISKSKPIQIMVLRNLVSKLKKGNNHHYVDRVKDISGLFKNELGPTNYALLADIFGLARETTAANHSSQSRLYPGLNNDAISFAARAFKGLPVNEGSDGARCLRYLHPRKSRDGKVVLVGYAWNSDVDTWKEEELTIPRKDSKKGDLDDFAAMKRLIDSLILKDKLSKSVSVHNLTALASLDKPTVINCMWPAQEKGYNHTHLLKYWESLRKSCYYEESGAIRKTPLNLIGYSTDSAGFSLSAAKHLMTPSSDEIREGVQYLGLGIDEERFLAPYYWFLPSIAYLDYDHEQRLFLKNLKYKTRDLTFWQENGKTIRLATIEHLKDLKHRCQVLGLDCGFSATDLLLIYFCDQNSDACEKLFTLRVADLLDEHVPGSHATSLYIRAVYHLIQPYRVPDFGSPEEVQKSVSCGINILRLWKKVVEIKKMFLHAKPGAKSNPSKRGHFITGGCYDTAEILFSAATIHQLAMFLHFKELGTRWASPYNSGTKSTERIIGEMQGKTNELQSLDSQPTFGDMLDKSTKVQFNLNAKNRLSADGANVKSTHKRKRLAFAFKKNEIRASSYPEKYSDFKAAQVNAHKEGVKDSQVLFEKYMPPECVRLLKTSGSWKKPYSYKVPEGCLVVNKCPPKEFNKLETSFANVNKDVISDAEDIDELDIPYLNNNDEEKQNDDQDTTLELQSEDEENDSEDGVGGKEWKLSKVVNGKTTYIHIKQAIKLLLPREYISRCRQKRHWAAKYLPGKEPLNPKHDVVKYCNVALKVIRNNKTIYEIARIESIESTTDGKEVLSFEMKGKPSAVRVRCSLYNKEENEIYFVPDDVVLTKWKSSSAIIGSVDLLPLPDSPGKYKLHHESIANLQKLGFLAKNDSLNKECNETDSPRTMTEDDLQSPTENNEGFYEIEEVIGRRLSKDTLTYEYKVRFKGYGPEDDMWLPSSFFNRAVQFESTSKFGRKRKHTVDPENVQVPPKRKRLSNKTKPENIKNSTSSTKPAKIYKPPKRGRSKEEKGKAFRSSLNNIMRTQQDKNEKVGTKTEQKTKLMGKTEKFKSSEDLESVTDTSEKSEHCVNKTPFIDVIDVEDLSFEEHFEEEGIESDGKNEKECTKTKKMKKRTGKTKKVRRSEDKDYGKATSEKQETTENRVNMTPFCSDVINVDDLSSEGEQVYEEGIMSDVVRRDDNFCYPRRILGYKTFPEVDQSLTAYKRCKKDQVVLTDPLSVTRLPSYSVLKQVAEECRNDANSDFIVKFLSYGNFDRKGIRILERFHRLKQLCEEVKFEEKWLTHAFENLEKVVEDKVTHALLDRWNMEGTKLQNILTRIFTVVWRKISF